MQEKEEVEEQSLESADWNYAFSQAAKEKSVIGVFNSGKEGAFFQAGEAPWAAAAD